MISDSEYFRASFTVFFEHGILAIEDLKSTASHAEWDVFSEEFHLDNDSLWVKVLGDVDGPVDISVFAEDVPSGVIEGFKRLAFGRLSIPHSWLIIHDSDDLMVFKTPVVPGSGLSIYTKGGKWVDEVVVVISRVDE